MTTAEAIKTLKAGKRLPELAEAVGVVCSDPATSFDALLLGLRHGGFVAEQAALALYKRTFRPLPMDRESLVTDYQEWANWLGDHTLPGQIDPDPGVLQAAHKISDYLRAWAAHLEAVRRTARPRAGKKGKRPSGRRTARR